ncbi:cysteine--tRNA ligase [Paenibacillus mucilaginosus]|uniref:Cysteine--tRNA ligase n=1 Tax=Paenibacillus mucilaginosus (strain KNP414) TaxID=1036673 RepID=F8FA65_PAEMK|nr:cysteine--tRNA ligase [Paenibacillus mucilaginosus]AEI46038.1 CysS [Paenibacillus mucilaginosus KNP414]MCG7217714.1 cysteine--tRNA ligase [Paenibacillus mucilaginosus]WDM27385.1 cysteine--tRNA ligase [Paenibacillus mucilaginosus]
MTLKIYNTMSRTKEEFRPLDPGKVKMYVCGPTVYDYIHIGNARPVIFFDVVRRYLESVGYEVNYVVNFTDVDDKLIRKASDMGMTVPEIADLFVQKYYEDTKGLGVREATLHPRVTQNMTEIIEFISGLEEKGLAYEAGGDVYFRTRSFPEYGKLSHQNLEELQYGIRVDVDERKENPQDFVLWKAAKPGEISWSSPWGEGRPGWHIECSAMVRKFLGDTIDIHGGGQDLAFPHHECEIAQSEGMTGHAMANYWMHNGFVNINNEKMSKSLGNGINVNRLLESIPSQVIRYFMLSGHYRNPLNFSDEAVEQAKGSLARLENCIAGLKHRLQSAAEGEAEEEVSAAVQAVKEQFEAKMNDDFNTPDAITAMFELVNFANPYAARESVRTASLQLLLEQFAAMDGVLGILTPEDEGLLDDEIEQLIIERTEARKSKNWARADEIRDLLTARGILLEDTAQGIRWRRK